MFIEKELATKRDLKELESRLKADILSLKADIFSLKADVIKWVAGMFLAQAAIIATLVKLL